MEEFPLREAHYGKCSVGGWRNRHDVPVFNAESCKTLNVSHVPTGRKVGEEIATLEAVRSYQVLGLSFFHLEYPAKAH